MDTEKLDFLKQELENNIALFEDTQNEDEKFYILNYIIDIKKTLSVKDETVYIDLKKWIRIYISYIENEKYDYDGIDINKISSRISSLNTEHQIAIIDYAIRLMRFGSYITHIDSLEKLKADLKIKLLHQNEKYSELMIALGTKNFTNLSILLVASVLMWAGIWYLLNNFLYLRVGIQMAELATNNASYFCYVSNLLCIVFGIDSDAKIVDFSGLFFVLCAKIYFFLLLTYFILKKLSKKLESL